MDALLEAFGIDWKLLIAQGVNFGLLLVVLWYFLYKPVMKTLDDRANLIKQGVEDAEAATAKLATADTEAATRVDAAEVEAQGLLSRARDEAGVERTRIVKEAEARAAALEKDAEMRAEENAARTLRESEQEIARLAILAAGKAMGK